MKKLFLIFACIPVSFMAHADKVASSCDAPDSVKAVYKEDAQRIALSRIYRTGAPEMQNAQIPQSWTDTIMRALLAVYNAPLPKTDTAEGHVVDLLKIHSRAYQAKDQHAYSLTEFTLGVDKSQQWVIDLQNKVFPTANAQVNGLMNKYHINVNNVFVSPNTPYVVLHTDSPYNMHPVADEWLKVTGVNKKELFGYMDGDYLIADEVTNEYVRLVYSYGYNDCPAGCISRKNWAYKVYYDCSVEFVGSWHGRLEMPTIPTNIPYCPAYYTNTLFPNPFTDRIVIDHNQTYDGYVITDVTGKVVKSGVLTENTITGLGDVPKGMYIITLTKDNIVSLKTKMIK